jgi:hypothetical protein
MDRAQGTHLGIAGEPGHVAGISCGQPGVQIVAFFGKRDRSDAGLVESMGAGALV